MMLGNWKSDFMEGLGEITWPDFFYKGELKRGRRHGHGIFYGMNYRYEGDWKYGLRHGYGREMMPCGELYVGIFENDNRNGLGTSYQSNNRTISITGEWKDDKQHGLCKTVSASGAISIAFQSNGELHQNE